VYVQLAAYISRDMCTSSVRGFKFIVAIVISALEHLLGIFNTMYENVLDQRATKTALIKTLFKTCQCLNEIESLH